MTTKHAYAIRFDYPESDDPMFAGMFKGGLGWAPTIKTAILFDNADEAHRTLENGYGPENRKWGRVVTVKAGQPA